MSPKARDFYEVEVRAHIHKFYVVESSMGEDIMQLLKKKCVRVKFQTLIQILQDTNIRMPESLFKLIRLKNNRKCWELRILNCGNQKYRIFFQKLHVNRNETSYVAFYWNVKKSNQITKKDISALEKTYSPKYEL